MSNLTRFNGLIKTDKAAELAAERQMEALFGPAPKPSRYEASHMTRILDKSGSMIGEKANQLKAAVAELERQFPDISTITLAFDDSVRRLDSINQYHPNGNTALRDSILAGIAVTEAEISHNNVIVPIVCDGEDNQSIATVEEVREAVEAKKALGWQFYVIHIAGRYSLSYQDRYDQMGIKSITEADISGAIDRLAQGIYGYLETGRLELPETT